MTITFKPGQHPDADQLSAFIEQALPAHERDGVLAHLAVCPDCRAVVALALPEEPVAVVAAEPRRPSIERLWFSGWMVFLPAAAAVAALAAFIFFVHRQAPAPQQRAQIAPAPAATAPPQFEVAPPAQLKAAPSSPQTRKAMPANPPAPGDKKMTANAEMGSVGAGLAEPPPPNAGQPAAPRVGVAENQLVQSVPAQNAVSAFAPAANDSVASQNQLSRQANAPQGVFHGESIGGTLRSNNALQQAEPNPQGRRQQNGVEQTGSQSMQVQAEAPAPVTTDSARSDTAIAGRAISNLSFTEQPLPSRLAVLSSAARGPIVLAIDTHHVVFVSNDSGQHWKTVRAVWKGRALMVEAAAPARLISLQDSGASMGTTLAGLPLGAVAAKMAGAIVTGTITDQSGAVVPGALVTATDQKAHASHIVTTDANGRYVVAGLGPGKYDLVATAQGFMSNHLGNVAVTASNENVANFTLRVGAATQTVTVESPQASVELNTAPELNAARKVEAAPKEKAQPVSAPLFEIVTDKGVHWVSADGISWQPQ
ncbi:MAG: carboxypeptidase regulatory-like domain-containing protein [Terracidiphilus sp.]